MSFPLIIGGAPSRYRINQSLRFRASNSAWLTRTNVSSPTNIRICTLSAWVKWSVQTGTQNIIGCDPGSPGFNLRFNVVSSTSFELAVDDPSNGSFALQTTRVFRDPSGWYHIVVAIDTTQATASNRIRLYVNGVEITSFSSASYPALNARCAINEASAAVAIGRRHATNASWYFDGYMAEVHFIDGQALTPASFGQTDATTGAWVPKRYTGTYGANGFYLPFNDATSTTTISQDRSGNGNNWTSSGISVTSGVTFDQMLDTPTNNYATLNPIVGSEFGTSPGLSAANLNSTGQNGGTIIPTIAMTTGKWYMEVVPTFASGNHYFGVRRLSTPPTAGPWAEMIASIQSGGWYDGAGNFTASGAATWASGDTLGLTWDADAGTLTIRVNDVQEWTYTVAGWAGVPVVFAYSPASPTGQSQVWNFGQRLFAYTPPSGFVALCTANLPSAAVTTSGSFTGNAAADGPFIWANGNPATLTINGNAVTFGTHADKTAGGFKLRSSSASYNTAGVNTWTATAGNRFRGTNGVPNNAQGNP